MLIPAVVLSHRITVRPYLGHAAAGPVYGTPFGVRALVEARRRVVRRVNAGPDVGSDVTSPCTATIRPLRPGRTIPAESKITLPPACSPTGAVQELEVLRVDVGQGLTRPAFVDLVLG